uniref:Ribosome biogenesis protein NOP53 n=1 Tax=Panagrellus redivivus TaxID=6233 RepID=A0A7E4W4D1_PANRE
MSSAQSSFEGYLTQAALIARASLSTRNADHSQLETARPVDPTPRIHVNIDNNDINMQKQRLMAILREHLSASRSVPARKVHFTDAGNDPSSLALDIRCRDALMMPRFDAERKERKQQSAALRNKREVQRERQLQRLAAKRRHDREVKKALLGIPKVSKRSSKLGQNSRLAALRISDMADDRPLLHRSRLETDRPLVPEEQLCHLVEALSVAEKDEVNERTI